jgi:leader peptidase (prepilin peptidase)/N-methyltransferase
MLTARMSSYEILFATTAFVLGSCIGSFLNVCIYRMPRGLKVNEPARSFCPSCKYAIPFYNNIPLVTWLVLRGKCANCGSRISFRYFGVELLTGLLFLAVWLHVWPHAWLHAFPYWILVALFVVATFIDLEHYIIPDEITWGGAVAGVLLSLAIPTLHGVSSNLLGGAWALVGAAVGYGLLWAVVELGKKAFGKKRLTFATAEKFTWTRQNDDAEFVVGEDKDLWSEHFARDSDRLLMTCPEVEIDGERFENAALEFHYDRLQIGGRKWELIKIATIRGTVSEVTIPREAMGFGDVKFMACIGAFLGWKAVLFTVMAGSTFGAVVGLLTVAIGKREWSAKIPFGPYLALGALLWLFYGPALLAAYLAYARGTV